MAIQQGLTISFRQEILQGEQDLLSDTLYIALYTALSNIGPNTTVYSTADEITGAGYTAGGRQLQNASIETSPSGDIYVSFDNVSWTNASFTTRGALIYNQTRGNKSIAVLNFGSDKTCSNQTFTITMPPNTATTALLRFY